MIAMNDVPHHLDSTYTTDRTGAPVFQGHALSGGRYRGLYTAKIIADVDAADGLPFALRFDLIAGASIGGILALYTAAQI